MWAGLFLLGAVSWAQPPGSIPPIYAQRLRMPVRGDDFAQPRAVVADQATGEIFVCDTLRNRIAIFDDKGRFRFQIPGGAAFQSPIDLAVDPEGYLFVASQVSAEVTLLDFDGRFIRRIALSNVPAGAAGARFSSLALSPEGDELYLLDVENDRLWITDRQGAVQRSVDLRVGLTAKEIDELRYGKVDIYGDSVLIPIPSDGLVHLFDLEGRPKGTIGDPGAAECQTIFPVAAALDDRGRVIILDQQRALFMTWDLARGACLSEHYGFGNAAGAFYQPNDLTLDAAGRLYVSQGFEGRVQVYEGARPAATNRETRQPPAAAADEPSPGQDAGDEPAGAEVPLTGETSTTTPAADTETPPSVEPTPREEPAVAATIAEVALPEEPLAAPPQAALPPLPQGPAAATAEATPSPRASLVVEGALLSVARAPRYDSTYTEMAYPGGDLPPDRGGAVEVVIRALRHAGVDLQQTIHEDIVGHLEAYGIHEPDPCIDHRRVRNLVTFLDRRATSLSTAPASDWAPGDIVFWDRDADGTAGHVGIVTAERGPSGNLLVVHHHRPEGPFPGTPAADDVLLRWPVVGHYRWPFAAEEP
jgi:uncharacterized protein YijF (DUF1287 family)/sugar lactone lactonase YvrE